MNSNKRTVTKAPKYQKSTIAHVNGGTEQSALYTTRKQSLNGRKIHAHDVYLYMSVVNEFPRTYLFSLAGGLSDNM